MQLDEFFNSAAVIALASAYSVLSGMIVSILAEYVLGDRYHSLAEIAKRRIMGGIVVTLAFLSYIGSCNTSLSFTSCDETGIVTTLAAILVSLGFGAAANQGIHSLFKRSQEA